jgi:hypothetical protein
VRRLAAVVVGLAVGLLAGVVSGLVRTELSGGFVDTWGNSIGVWLLVPFAAGVCARSWRRALGAGVLASLAQLGGFYAVTGALESVASVAFWAGGALVGGSLFGVVGFCARRLPRGSRSPANSLPCAGSRRGA